MSIDGGDLLKLAKLAGVEKVELPALVLRAFDWRLRPQFDDAGRVTGIALDVLPKVGLPLQVTMMFDRSEFVSLATAGLGGLDSADELTPAAPEAPEPIACGAEHPYIAAAPCQREAGHEGNHRYTSSADGRSIDWPSE